MKGEHIKKVESVDKNGDVVLPTQMPVRHSNSQLILVDFPVPYIHNGFGTSVNINEHVIQPHHSMTNNNVHNSAILGDSDDHCCDIVADCCVIT